MTSTPNPSPPIGAVIMGVSGSGKTVVGRTVAQRLGWTFVDADNFHPESNVAKMGDGVPLTDADRQPWLETLNKLLRSKQSEGVAVVLACSALKRSYRLTLAEGVPGLRFVHLDVPQPVIFERLQQRQGHFASSALVPSQFADLEVPDGDEATIIDADRPKAKVIEDVVAALQK
ncbi:MAG: gluconokinase [Microthrixaceae bacterium]